MNERIRELETQAWDYAYDHETVKGKVAFDGFINANFFDEFSKKLAELIVRECALTAGLMEHQGRTGIGAQLLDNFEIKD
jgi:hypothetical protein